MKSVSLKKRFFNHSAITLTLLISFSALVVYLGFIAEIKRNTQEQLQLHIYNLLSVAEFDGEQLTLPDIMYHPRFNTADSGLFAMVLNQSKADVWHTLSIENPITVGIELPSAAGEWQSGQIRDNNNQYLTMSYRVDWLSGEVEESFYLVIGELSDSYNATVKKFSWLLVFGFLVITTLLLIGQFIVLRKAFKPIQTIEKEIVELEEGIRDSLSEHYPDELTGVQRNINALITKEFRQRERYREGMENLAHSLKTPITIISNEINRYQENHVLKSALGSANKNIEYHLRRAVMTGHSLHSQGVKVTDVISMVTDAMGIIYSEKAISVDVQVSADTMFYGDESDLTEIFGNLIDNAHKFAFKEIAISVKADDEGLTVVVEDDGAGLNETECQKIFNRGERLDQQWLPQSEGQGIGLAIVYDIIASYKGTITVTRSNLGGACFTINFTNRES